MMIRDWLFTTFRPVGSSAGDSSSAGGASPESDRNRTSVESDRPSAAEEAKAFSKNTLSQDAVPIASNADYMASANANFCSNQSSSEQHPPQLRTNFRDSPSSSEENSSSLGTT